VAFGEVGLAGEVRAVDRARQRVAEAKKFGFNQCVLPKSSAADVEGMGVNCWAAGSLTQALEAALER
jgi:DNA repair protein RadA/Sms